ncbi:putative RNA-directed DNA polymerase from transposon X-element [Trichonephila clavipes]|nr:putative RNA-directed DNA polymerase from transposon X-element [Trichonephila clavipes]
MLYVDDLQVSCQGSDMRLIERQLQTTVNRLVQWCNQNGHTISPSKSSCVHFCRKRNLHPDPSIHIGHIQIPVVSAVRFLGRIVSLLRVYQALILSRLDYGCVVYGSARASVLKRLDTVYHSALRICSGAFKTSPVTSLYVVCHQPPLELRRRQLCANYFIRAMSVPSHPLKPFALAIGLNRLYEARSFNIKPFSERAKAVLNDAHLNHINIQENNIFAFPPWDIQIFNYHNPFSGYDKADTAAVIYQQLFYFHRNRYSKYIPVYTDGSKTAAHVGCGVIFNNTILSFSLHHSMSVFSAELTAILVALQHIIVSNHRHFCVYTDSMSALESLHFSTEHRHPTVIEILLLLRKLERKGFDVIFPGYLDTWVYLNYIHRVWQETWDQQVLNKLHSIHPSTSHWVALPVRRHDVRLTRLRIGHTRFTHRHLLLGFTIRGRSKISCEGSDMRMIERQLQTAVNNILKWCDTNGHIFRRARVAAFFAAKSNFRPPAHFPSAYFTIAEDLGQKVSKPLEGVVKHLLGADRTSLLSVPGNRTLSHRLRMCCIRISVRLYSEKLDPVHHMALRICSGAFRTSPVQSLYVNCHQLPLDLRRRKLSLAFYFKILSVPSHPLQNVYMSTSMKRIYDARPSNIRPFMDRMKLHLSELDLPNVRIQQRNLFLFQPWNTPRFLYINPFATYSKSTVAPVVFQRVFAYHRSQYSRYSAIYTDGSKRADTLAVES